MRTENNPQTKASNPKDLLAEGESRVLLHLIPSPGLIHTALAFMDGARKYGAYNWREEGVGAGTYLSAAKRHIADWLDGEENADDSGVHHLGHAVACLMILMDAQAVENLVDDRPLPAPTAEMMERVKAGGGLELGSTLATTHKYRRALCCVCGHNLICAPGCIAQTYPDPLR